MEDTSTDRIKSETASLTVDETVTTAGARPPVPTHTVPSAASLGLSNKYEILSVIGQGGMSVVYKARHRLTEQILAIKMLKGHLSHDKVQLQRFIQEARAMEKLDHPNIISARDVDYTGEGQPYLVMDFLEGRSLAESIAHEGKLAPMKAVQIFLQACDALQHAHNNGVVHRDIKPSNIILVDSDAAPTVKIVDFGIAKLIKDNDSSAPVLTQTGEVFGSPAYMSPEQCLGHALDSRSDIYSLGCVMYETLSGKPPFSGGSALEIIQNHTREVAEPLSVEGCDKRLAKRLDEIVYRTMEKNPASRYQSAAQLKADLEELQDLDQLTGASGFHVNLSRWRRRIARTIDRHALLFAVSISCLVVLVPASVYGWSVLSPLLEAPKPLVTFQWVWDIPELKPKSASYGEIVRRGLFVIGEGQLRSGFGIKQVKQREALAGYMEQHGDWLGALPQLARVISDYERLPACGLNAIDTIEAIQEYALCEYRLGDYKQAAHWFGVATRRFEKFKEVGEPQLGSAQSGWRLIGNSFAPIMQIRYANSLRLTDSVDAALKLYGEALKTAGDGDYQLSEAMAMAGLADCKLIQAKTASGENRTSLLQQAAEGYRAAQQLWESRSATNPQFALNVGLCKLGLANVAIMQGDNAKAATLLNSVSNGHVSSKLFAERAARMNWARVLWRNGDFFNAVKVSQGDRG